VLLVLLLDGDFMQLLKRLTIKLFVRIILIIILGIIVFVFEYHLSPNYSEDDIYEIKGKCIDICIENEHSGRISRKYILMSNGEKYYVHSFHQETIVSGLDSLKGRELVFWASDKSIWWHQEHTLVAWGDTPSLKEETLDSLNQNNRINRISIMGIYLIVGSLFIIPQILRVSECRDDNKKQLEKSKRKK
jgi:hypothetical protein